MSISLRLLFISLLLLTTCKKKELPAFSHTEKIGASSQGFISSNIYNSIYIEIDYVNGFKPSETSITNLKNFLELFTSKPNGIVISLDDEIKKYAESYRPNYLAILEQNNRDTYTNGKSISAYFLILNGQLGNSTSGGSNFYNTSAALFPDQLKKISDTLSTGTFDDVLSVSLIHEFGHMLGLVDIGTPMLEEHDYLNVPGHCSNRQCIMWPVIDEEMISTFLNNTEVFGLGNYCQQDLNAVLNN